MNLSVIRPSLALLAACAALTASSQNYIRDGDFESAAGAANSFTRYLPGTSFDSYWRILDYDPTIASVGIEKRPVFVVDGLASLYLANYGVYQNFFPPSRTYSDCLVSFDAYVPAGNLPASLTVNGRTMLVQPSAPGVRGTHYSFVGSFGGSFDSLYFGTTGALFIDNVSLTSVPEPSALAALGLPVLGLLKRRKRA